MSTDVTQMLPLGIRTTIKALYINGLLAVQGNLR